MREFSKLLMALAAAGLLSATPVYAQTGGDNGEGAAAGADAGGGGGAEVVESQDLDERVSPFKHQMGETFRGLEMAPAATVTFDPTIGAAVPDTVTLAPVPQEIISLSPDVTGYQYFTLPDGRIALVHPEERTIATIID